MKEIDERERWRDLFVLVNSESIFCICTQTRSQAPGLREENVFVRANVCVCLGGLYFHFNSIKSPVNIKIA